MFPDFPRRRCLLAVAATILSSCVASDDGVTSQVPSGADGAQQVRSDVQPLALDEREVRRLGDGRALVARSSPSNDRLVVATTAGIAFSDGWLADPTVIPRPGSGVALAALSTEGDRFALMDAASDEVEVWDLESRDEAFVVPVVTGSEVVRSLTYLPGDELIVGTNRSVTSWSPDGDPTPLVDAAEGRELGSVAVSPTGDRIVAIESDGASTSLAEWSEADGATSIPVPVDEGSTAGRVELTADGTRAVIEVRSSVEPESDALVVVQLVDGVAVSEPVGAGLLVGADWALGPGDRVAFAQAGVLTVASLDGGVIGRADLAGLPAVRSLSPGGDGFVTSHADGSMVVWDQDAAQRAQLPPSVGPLLDVSTPDERSVLTVGQDGHIDTWDLTDGTSAGVIDRYANGAVNSVALSPDSERLVVARKTGEVDVIDTATGAIGLRLDHDGRNVDSAAFDPEGSEIVTGVGERIGFEAFDDSVSVWDTLTGDRILQTGGEGENVAGCSFFDNLVAYSPDGELVAASSHDFTVGLYHADDLSVAAELKPHESSVLDIAFSPDGRYLATSADDWTLRVWSIPDAELVGEYDVVVGGYRSIAFSPDGSTIATVGVTGEVALINTADGQVTMTFDDTANWSSNIEFSADGSAIVAGGRDGGVLLWQTADGSVSQRLEVPGGLVSSVDLSADDGLLVAGSDDGTISQWER